jgi:hypothetical protein
MIFVFGSNLAGRHGKGAALYAKQYKGAIYGKGYGRQGNSYAIPTKDRNLQTLPLEEIQIHVNSFLLYASKNPELKFELTPIGCGLAGYKPEDIAPMFKDAPLNISLPMAFVKVLVKLLEENKITSTRSLKDGEDLNERITL